MINSYYCSECICHEDGTRHPDEYEGSTLEWTTTVSTPREITCPLAKIGDGYCEDSMNIEECNYDGGDCCSKNSWYLYCKACICHPEAPQNPNEKKIGYSEQINDEKPIICNTCSASQTLVALQIGSLLLIIGLISKIS